MRRVILVAIVLASAPGCALVLDWDFALEPLEDGGGPGRDAPGDAPPTDTPAADAGPADAGDGGCPACPPRAIAIAAGTHHTLVVDERGQVWCWGDSIGGQCGVIADQTAPTSVDVMGTPLRVAGGTLHSCALTTMGVECWGQNGSGELGTGVPGGRATDPVMMGGSEGALAVTAGSAFTCVIQPGGRVACTGTNTVGELGRGMDRTSTATLGPSEVSVATAVAAADHHACAIDNDGAVLCWGANVLGQLGRGMNGDGDGIPTPIMSTGVFELIAAGQDHTCGALRASGAIFCWGRGGDGQLGDGAMVDRAAPVEVAGLATMADDGRARIAGGDGHTCAIDRAGALFCWGRNNRGQLGAGDTADRVMPRQLAAPAAVVEVAAGFEHTCAIDTGGAVWCWGSNTRGQLGIDMSMMEAHSPEPVELR